MPLRLDIKRKLTVRSDRVKSVDQHPTENWLLCSLYNGEVNIWNHETQTSIKKFEVCNLPVRTAKFVPRKNWVLTGSDDMQIRVFNYNTLERIHAYEAHSDYIRDIAVHPKQPFILTSSDDMMIKLWNWDYNWACQQVYEGHVHYVMQIAWNPKDTNTFASGSLDRTVKVWQLGSSTANFTLEGHEKGINCVDYYHGGDKPYLISGADDHRIKIWDYQTKSCVQTLEGHSQNVSAVKFHPELPILLTGSEDGTVRIWHAGTYRLESTLNYGFERIWYISCKHSSNDVAIGYDEGTIMIKVGREEPAVSMDVNGGKIIWAKHNEIQQVNLKAIPEGTEIKDGERLSVIVKEIGSCEIFPQMIAHNPNGRFVVVCGDGEYIIYTAMALRNKAYGSAHEFVWALDNSEYATLENSTTVKVYRNFKERKSFKLEYGADGIFGGAMLGVRSVSGLPFSFYDWESLELIRRIEIQPKFVFWSENGNLVCLATAESYFILQCNAKVIASSAGDKNTTEDGLENAFEVLSEINEIVKTGLWVGDCFIYTNSANRINYFVGGEIVTISHLDHPMYILGYIPKQNSLFLCDKELNIYSYTLLLSVLGYQTALLRKDFETADQILPTVLKEHRTRLAHFLEKHGFRQQALAISTDPEHKFDLAMALGDLKVALELAQAADTASELSASELRWRRLAILAGSKSDTQIMKFCYEKANDFGGLIMLATSTGNCELLNQTADAAKSQEQFNSSFLSYFLTGNLDECLGLLISTNRIPEAAFFARSYVPSKVPEVVKLWQAYLTSQNKKAAQSIASPALYSNLFPNFEESLELEKSEREKLFTSKQMTEPLVSEPPIQSFSNTKEVKQDNCKDETLVDLSETEVNEGLSFSSDNKTDHLLELLSLQNIENGKNIVSQVNDSSDSLIKSETSNDLPKTFEQKLKVSDSSTWSNATTPSEYELTSERHLHQEIESQPSANTARHSVEELTSENVTQSIPPKNTLNDLNEDDLELEDFGLSHISMDEAGDDALDDIPEEEFLAMMSDMNCELEKN